MARAGAGAGAGADNTWSILDYDVVIQNKVEDDVTATPPDLWTAKPVDRTRWYMLPTCGSGGSGGGQGSGPSDEGDSVDPPEPSQAMEESVSSLNHYQSCNLLLFFVCLLLFR